MSSELRRAKQRTDTRERILAAARQLFVAQGFEAVSMRKIAAAIDYTPAAIYTHFADKTALMMALGDSDFRLLRESMREVDSIADPVDRLLAEGRAYISFAFAHPHHYRLMFMTSWPHIEPAECGIEHGNPDEDAFACLQQVVADCIAQARFRPEYNDVAQVTQACWAAVHGVVSLYITHGTDPWVNFQSPRETADILLRTHVAGLLHIAAASLPRTPPTSRPARTSRPAPTRRERSL